VPSSPWILQRVFISSLQTYSKRSKDVYSKIASAAPTARSNALLVNDRSLAAKGLTSSMLAVVGNGEAEASGQADIVVELPELGGGFGGVSKNLICRRWRSRKCCISLLA
jgi:hypothetical protein